MVEEYDHYSQQRRSTALEILTQAANMYSGAEHAELISNLGHGLNLPGGSNINDAHPISNNLLSTYHDSGMLSTTAMGSVESGFNISSSERNSYTDGTYQGIGAMSASYSNPLSVLSMESYDDGRAALVAREQHESRLRESAVASFPFGISSHPDNKANEKPESKPVQKKKRKTDHSNGEEDQEGSKKIRGRPRVDTQDETAADRRRTQIRMAQRAYRHRKESTIATLEQRVEKLLKTNEEMNAVFVALHDFAVSKGVLQREPEFGRKLLSSTEKMLILAKATSDENARQESKNDGDSEGTNHSGHDADPARQRRGRPSSKKQSPETTTGKLEPAGLTTSSSIWGGYIVTNSDEKEEDEIPLNVSHDESGYSLKHREPDVEVISRPTEDNASFPFDFDFMDLQQYRVELPPDLFSKDALGSGLPLPSSGAFSEFSFARRLHRTALERGYLIITSKTANPVAIQKIFGFCLLYETPAEITTRLKRLILGSKMDSLHNFRAPFYHIGDNGSHYPQQEHTVNDETTLKYGDHGRSMGPFLPPLSQFEEVYMNKSRCALPGYEGVFYDSYDIEGILHTIGIDIPPAADYVTCELDIQNFVDHFPASLIADRTAATTPNLESKTSDGKTPRDEVLDPGLFSSLLPFPLSKGFGDWEVDSDEKTPSANELIHSIIPAAATEKTSSLIPKRLVTINVQTLIEKLLVRCICLGRGPGCRISDIYSAIIAAIKAGYW
ncbi:hypothetical protein B7463_g44, partial [Scytalidium lignicola]